MMSKLLICSTTIFGYFFLAVTILNNAMGGLEMSMVIGSPLLASAFSALLALFLKRQSIVRLNDAFLAGCCISLPIALFMIARTQEIMDMNAQIPDGSHILWSHLKTDQYTGMFASALSLPFLFYGLFLCSTFLNSSSAKSPLIYSIELVGIFVGSLIATVFFDLSSIHAVMVVIFLLPCLILSAGSTKWFIRLVSGTSILLLHRNPSLFLAQREIDWSARVFSSEYKVEELAQKWNAYSKVQKLRVHYHEKSSKDIISIGDGIGVSKIQSNKNGGHLVKEQLAGQLLKAINSKNSLILFAGSGIELASVHQENPKAQVTGVEINKIVIDQSLNHFPFFLRNNLKNPNVQMINSDSRVFLEQTSRTFDAIVFSWSGSVFTFAAGAHLHSTHYSYTEDSISRAIELLSPNGVLIFFGGPKINIALSLLKLYGPLDNSVALLAPPDQKLNWHNGWDHTLLVFRKGGLEQEDLQKLDRTNEGDFALFYPSDRSIQEDEFFQAAQAKSYSSAKEKINQGQSHFFSHSDNHPFLYRLQKPHTYDSSFWFAQLKDLVSHPLTYSPYKSFLLILSLWAMLALLLPVFPKNLAEKLPLFLVCSGTGAFFSFSSILVAFKLLLYVSNPTMAIVGSQLTVVGAGFLGGILSYKKTKDFSSLFLVFLTFTASILFVAAFRIQDLFFIKLIGPLLFVGLCLPLGCMNSYLYSNSIRNLMSADRKLISLALATNMLLSAAVSFLAPELVKNSGIIQVLEWALVCLFLTMVAYCYLRYSSKNQLG